MLGAALVGSLALSFAPALKSPLVPRPVVAPRAPAPVSSAGVAAAWIGGSVITGASGAVFVVVRARSRPIIRLTERVFDGCPLSISLSHSQRNLDPWYAGLAKPSWSPPDRVFAPVWTTLYALIGLSCARALGNPFATPARGALIAYATQAVLNLSWAPIFFGAHRLRLGFCVSSALLASAVHMTAVFSAVAGTATAALLLPYLAWLTFATGLNLRLWQLNGPTR